MPMHPGDIITVPSVELETIHPAILAFSALADEDGDPDRMIGRRSMNVDMVSSISLFAHDDYDMAAPILILQIPASGMPMSLVEDLCDLAIQHRASSLGEGIHAPHDAWHIRMDGDAILIRPRGGGTVVD